MATHLILGTAGHIDHGKTSLIRALTGTDTDRLPEEKRRGITIDLGFAELDLGDYRLGVVDAPGHERFVRNMLAGATGYDVALLVVAADDSVKPQTLEHLSILRLLQLRAGVIAITKRDLVAPDWLALVEEEVRGLVAGSFLEHSPLVAVSAATGEGIAELRAALRQAAEQAAGRDDGNAQQRQQAPFRMPIDRTFTVAGHGAVVTGSVASGAVKIGDELTIEPGAIAVRVRGLHHHDKPVEQVERGQRAAINLAGVRHDEIARGQELASPGHLRSSRCLTARVSLLNTAPRPLKSRERVKVHLGAMETPAAVRLLGPSRLEPGQSALCQLFPRDPVAAIWRQPLVIRSLSPTATIGGGVVLDPNARPLRRPDEEALRRLAALESPDPFVRAEATAWLAGAAGWSAADLPRLAGVTQTTEVETLLRGKQTIVDIPVSPTRKLTVHTAVLDSLAHRLEARLAKLHDRRPLELAFDIREVTSKLAWLCPEPVLAAALARVQQSGKLRAAEGRIGLAGRGPRLSKNEEKALVRIIERYQQAGLESPSVAQVEEELGKNRESAKGLMALAVREGRLVQVTPDYLLHPESERQARRTLAEALAGDRGLTVSEIREVLGTTRKYAVPLCEYFDRVGFTRRQEDRRVLAKDDGGKLS